VRLGSTAEVALAAAMIAVSAPASAQFGQLAPGGIHWSLSGVEAEVAITFAMPPRFVSDMVPRGLSVLTLAQAVRQDSAARALLSAHPDWASYAITIFSVALIDSTAFDDSPGSIRSGASAVWWLPALQDSAVTFDPRSKPGDQLIELASWSADEQFAHRLHAIMPSASAAGVTMSRDALNGEWSIHLQEPGATFTGTCRPRGNAALASYSLPQYSTVWAAGPMPSAFVVYTYYGHLVRPCEGSLRATGSSKLARAFEEGAILRIDEQSGWRARAAAYRPR
jgi:hypothetical protein